MGEILPQEKKGGGPSQKIPDVKWAQYQVVPSMVMTKECVMLLCFHCPSSSSHMTTLAIYYAQHPSWEARASQPKKHMRISWEKIKLLLSRSIDSQSPGRGFKHAYLLRSQMMYTKNHCQETNVFRYDKGTWNKNQKHHSIGQWKWSPNLQ